MMAGDEVYGDDVTSGIVDPLFPYNSRPLCSSCATRPVYLAGLCGECYASPRGDAHAYECWAGRGGICRIGCSCSCHISESELRLLDGNR